MRFFVARHGETDWNTKNRILGRTDIGLNDNGRRQALELSRTLSDTGIGAIYVSPLLRAVETANIVQSACPDAGFFTEQALIEQDFGIFEGKDRGDLIYQKAKRMYASRYPGGESYFDVVSRVYPFMQSLKENEQYNTVLIVTHGGICRVINSYFEDMDNESFSAFVTPNCGYKEYLL